MTFEGHFIHCKRFRCLCLKDTVLYVDEVNYNGRTSYVSNYFYCRVRPDGLLCDAERNLLAIANFFCYVLMCCRIDRSRWNPGESIVGKVDAHLLNDAYKRPQWDRLTPLLAALHGKTSENFAWSLKYYDKFTILNRRRT